MGKTVTTLFSFFKKKGTEASQDIVSPSEETEELVSPPVVVKRPVVDSSQLNRPKKKQRGDIDINNLERDPGLRPHISSYHGDVKDEVRRAYLAMGPYKFKMEEYPLNDDPNPRRFVFDWFALFPDWLEYSPDKRCFILLALFSFSHTKGSQRF
ncbi:uncharacterized protein A4U43_C03F17170 [Asparagus officinalis]|uniref:Uncharacterized protein n=1 Tax=Asparagus officinalis TaxID=4686 RepID=A0A5P1FFY9_ASPOF|nr:uncharacterized protein A4U43_C03F17170 [Asparagus officinalis]